MVLNFGSSEVLSEVLSEFPPLRNIVFFGEVLKNRPISGQLSFKLLSEFQMV
jgi:hypothetical protein